MSEGRSRMRPVTGLRRTDSLPPPPPRPQPTAPVPEAPPKAAKSRQEPAESKPRRPASRGQPGAARASDRAEIIRPISISMPVSLVERFKAHARTTGTSHPDLLMDAVLAQRDRLGDLVAQARPEPPRDELFVRNIRRGGGELTHTLPLRMKSTNVDAIDKLVTEHGAENRSQLCTAALRAHLT